MAGIISFGKDVLMKSTLILLLILVPLFGISQKKKIPTPTIYETVKGLPGMSNRVGTYQRWYFLLGTAMSAMFSGLLKPYFPVGGIRLRG